MKNQIALQLAQFEEAGLPSNDEVIVPQATPDVKALGENLSDLINSAHEISVYSVQATQPSFAASVSTHTLGDAIMQKLDSMGTAFRTRVERAHHMLEALPDTYSLQEMLKLQLEMSAVSIEIEVVGKGVQKAVQHADHLS